MVKNYLSRSWAVTMRFETSSCQPAYQERRRITHALLREAVPQCVCCSHLQTGKRRSVAPNRPTRPTWPTFARRQQCELDHTNPALLRPSGLFNDFYVTSSSRHDPVHILPTSSSKSALNIVKWSSRCFVHFLPSSSSKRLQVVLTFFELSPQSCTLFVENFARWRPATAETETLLRRPQKPHYPKTIGFAPRVFSPTNSSVPELLRSSSAPTQDWHEWSHDDDLVMTWWWHHQETAPEHASVTR